MPAPEPVDFSPLVAFLLARVEEELYGGGCGGPDRSCEYLTDRWLSQCEATKRLALRAWITDEPYVLRCLSLPWVNHPDYRAEWRP